MKNYILLFALLSTFRIHGQRPENSESTRVDSRRFILQKIYEHEFNYSKNVIQGKALVIALDETPFDQPNEVVFKISDGYDLVKIRLGSKTFPLHTFCDSIEFFPVKNDYYIFEMSFTMYPNKSFDKSQYKSSPEFFMLPENQPILLSTNNAKLNFASLYLGAFQSAYGHEKEIELARNNVIRYYANQYIQVKRLVWMKDLNLHNFNDENYESSISLSADYKKYWKIDDDTTISNSELNDYLICLKIEQEINAFQNFNFQLPHSLEQVEWRKLTHDHQSLEENYSSFLSQKKLFLANGVVVDGVSFPISFKDINSVHVRDNFLVAADSSSLVDSTTFIRFEDASDFLESVAMFSSRVNFLPNLVNRTIEATKWEITVTYNFSGRKITLFTDDNIDFYCGPSDNLTKTPMSIGTTGLFGKSDVIYLPEPDPINQSQLFSQYAQIRLGYSIFNMLEVGSSSDFNLLLQACLQSAERSDDYDFVAKNYSVVFSPDFLTIAINGGDNNKSYDLKYWENLWIKDSDKSTGRNLSIADIFSKPREK